MLDNERDVLTRAGAVLTNATFGRIGAATAVEYRAVAARLDAERLAAGAAWGGPCAGARSPATAAVRRAAWARRVHVEVASAFRDLREGRVDVPVAMGLLRTWVPLAEACRPSPVRDTDGLSRGRPPAGSVRPAPSKRAGLRSLPDDWLDTLWRAAVRRDCRHLDGVAVLLATGCRPSEACRGVAVRRVPGGVDVAVLGSKVTATAGQEWRHLTVALDDRGPMAHLAGLADAAGGVARVRPACTPNALSMAVADVAEDCLPGRRLSAYDVRHQRAADARNAFEGDMERLAAWLGHAGVETVRYYGRLPRSAGSRGARPLAAATANAVRRRALMVVVAPAASTRV